MSWLQDIGANIAQLGRGLSDGLSGYGSSGSRFDHALQAEAAPNPMQEFVDELRLMHRRDGAELTLSNLFCHAQQRFALQGLAAEDIGPALANMSGCDVRGMVMDQAGVDYLRDIWADASDQPVDLRGANMNGCIFRPASTVNGILIDAVTVGRSTTMQHLSFDGFNEGAHLQLGEADVSFFAVSGEANHAHHMVMEFEGTKAEGANIANSRYTKITARQSDEGRATNLSGLEATNARALKIDAVGCELSGARFAQASFAPGTQMTNCNLIAADFSGAIMSGVDLSGSRLSGAHFHGVDITNVALANAELRPQDLEGALYQGQLVGTDIAADKVMQEMGINAAAENVYTYIDTVEQVVERLDRVRADGADQPELAAPISDMGAIAREDFMADMHVENIPLCETDEFIQLIVRTHGKMQGVQQTQNDMIKANNEHTLADNHEANRHKVDHSEEYIGRGNA